MSHRLGSVRAGADQANVSTKTIRRLIARGELAAYRVGSTRSIKIDLDELDGLLRPVTPAEAEGMA